jgi:hypothetical protein
MKFKCISLNVLPVKLQATLPESVTWLWIRRLGSEIRESCCFGLVRGKTFPDGLWGLPSLLFSRYRCSFPGVKRPSAKLPAHLHIELMELYCYFPMCLHGVDIVLTRPTMGPLNRLFSRAFEGNVLLANPDYLVLSICRARSSVTAPQSGPWALPVLFLPVSFCNLTFRRHLTH